MALTAHYEAHPHDQAEPALESVKQLARDLGLTPATAKIYKTKDMVILEVK